MAADRVRPAIALAAVLVAACSVAEKLPSAGGGGGDGITGTSMLTHYIRSGDSVTTTTAMEDLTIYSYAAYVPDSAEPTGYRVIDGTGTASGTLVIPGVPQGPYYLRVLVSGSPVPTFYYTDDRVLDLGFGTAGRPGLRDVALPSSIVPSITGMDRALSTDFFSLHSLGTGTEHYPIDFGGGAPIGNVGMLSAAFDWTTGYGWALPRMRPKLLEGDDLEILHHRSVESPLPAGHLRVDRLTEIARMSGLTQADGTALAVSGAFVDVPQATAARAEFAITPLHDAYAGSPPAHVTVRSAIGVVLGLDPWNGFGPGLVGFEQFNVPLSTTQIDVDLAYGNPYNGTWVSFGRHTYLRRQRVRLPGVPATGPGAIIITQVNIDAAYGGGNVTLPLLLAPPAGLRVGGATAADGVRPFDGSSPIAVQWNAVTNAVRYQVTARRLTMTGDLAPAVATMITTETSVAFPAEYFATGERYVFVVAALRDSLTYASGRLRATVMPTYLASAATGVILLSTTCGNGVREGAEECDTSGQSATCDVDCSLPVCRDGLLNTAAGEQCDVGLETPGCNANCTLTMCGDGRVNLSAGEQCDDDNTSTGDGCDDQCHWEDSCPDGNHQPAFGEECDDGNRGDSDNCPTTCRNPLCGDGFVWSGNEQCDDGNAVNGDGCRDDCTVEP